MISHILSTELGTTEKMGTEDSVKIIGYGEDALTLQALKNERIFSEIFGLLPKELQPIRPDNSEAFFRPSFGRGASPSFGEFDAILLTPKAVLLVESKWRKWEEWQGHPNWKGLVLDAPQTRRHRIFDIYLNHFRSSENDAQQTFLSNPDLKLSLERLDRHAPKETSDLGINLFNVLQKMEEPYGSRAQIPACKNVLLVFRRGEMPSNTTPTVRLVDGGPHNLAKEHDPLGISDFLVLEVDRRGPNFFEL